MLVGPGGCLYIFGPDGRSVPIGALFIVFNSGKSLKSNEERFMQRALVLAGRGKAWVAPNPMVGAVVVKDGVVVGEGYHKRFGGPHAEVYALEKAGDKARGADLYVNLEPCCHFGKTPPCADRIIDTGVKRVFAAIRDPNPKVNGKGFEKLREAGIEVHIGVCEGQAKELNQRYLKKAETGHTWVTLKVAQTIDGRIASITGHSQWITSKKSRRYAHLMRATHDAVLVGSGTAITDNPSLTVRHLPGRNPVRIVLDTNFRMRPYLKLLSTPDDAPTWVFGAPRDGKLPDWAYLPNVEVFIVERNENNHVDLKSLLGKLAELGIVSLMVEGGSEIWTAFLDAGLVDKVEIVIAPIILGHGIDAISDLGIEKVHEAIRLEQLHTRRIGEDLHVVARIHHEHTGQESS